MHASTLPTFPSPLPDRTCTRRKSRCRWFFAGAATGVLVGIINLFTLQRREFSDDEISFLQTVAGELAIGIENAQLYSRTDARLQRKIHELGTMQRVSHTIASTLDLDDVLRLIAEQAVVLFNVEAAPPSSDSRDVTKVPPVQPSVTALDGRARSSTNLDGTRSFARSCKPALLAPSTWSTSTDRGASFAFRFALHENLSAHSVFAWLPAPNCRKTSSGFLQAFSDAATVAIENATLYEDTRRRSRGRFSTVARDASSRPQQLQTVAAPVVHPAAPQ